MSRTLKWVLGILAVLVVVALIAGAFWLWQTRSQMMASYGQSVTQPNAKGTPGAPNATPGQGQPWGPKGFGDDRRGPMRGWDGRGPMMGQRPFMHVGPFMPFGMGFFFLGGLFRLIVPLIVLGLVALLFYQLGRRSGLGAGLSTPAAPPEGQHKSE